MPLYNVFFQVWSTWISNYCPGQLEPTEQCFSNFFARRHLVASKKITTNPRIIAYENIGCLDSRCAKLKIFVSKLMIRVVFTVCLSSDWHQNRGMIDCQYLSIRSALTLQTTRVKNGPVEITNKMQPYNRIYYSKVYWRLNMFRAAYRSSSGAPNSICSLWFIYTCGDRPLSRLCGKISHTALTMAGHHMYI